MATISVSEEDFSVVFNAARDAQEKEDLESAEALDKIARKMNVSLAGKGATNQRLRWKDAPSCLRNTDLP